MEKAMKKKNAMNKEQVYDAQIAPLMAQIIDVCKANKIPVLATFHIPTEEDENLECTTALLLRSFNPPERLIEALKIIRPPSRSPLMVTTRDGSGNVIRMDAIL
jgi:hypothetical protein